MRYLCIDPGLGRCGYCVAQKGTLPALVHVIAAGTLTTPKEMTLVNRLCLISKLMGMVKDKFAPDEIWIEETPARGNVVGAMLCQAKGALLVNFEGFVVNMIYPNTIKMVVAGHGLASKIAVREVCKHKVSFEGNVVMDSLDDAWDAIALAVYAFMPKVSKSGPEPPRRFRNDAETQTTQAQV